MKKNITYEQAYNELQEIAQAIEEETIGVDELADKLSRAAELSAYCQSKLRATEDSVNRILEQMDKQGS
ncbi:hypothetical protein GCM10027037_24480 [Mucilaginibacter koreensis]